MIDGVETQIERTKRRKTIGLEIHPGPVVRVLAPSFLSDEQLQNALQTKSSWIQKNLKDSMVKEKSKEKEMVSGESIPFKGTDYRLKVINGVNAPVTLKDSYIIVSVPHSVAFKDKDEYIKHSLIEWYKKQASELLPPIVERMANKIGVQPNSFSIKDYKRSWGRCSPDGDIYINWRVIMQRPCLIAYVICHELCHLVHCDHSNEFWNFLSEFCTNPKDLEKELNEVIYVNGIFGGI